ncbi:MAG: glycosyltransferase family 4 protein [Hyphomicrobiales bacterium]|nr:glycosyltransferase family 4 protein [Hyphomicrobiales bacterium]
MVLPTYLPESFGGAEQQCRRLSTALARRGVGVAILAPRLKRATPAHETEGAVTVRRFRLRSAPNLGGRHMASYLVWCACILGWLWRHRGEYDLIHIFHGRLHAVPAVVAGAMLGKPTLIKIGSGGPESFDLGVVFRKRLFGRTFARLIARHASAYVANSREIADDLRRWGIPENRIHRIPNGVELPDLDAAPRAGGGNSFVFLGRLDREKAVDLMIRGFARLPERRARLAIVGDGPCRRELEALADELRVAGRVTFAGALSDVASALRAADFFVSTSLSEGMSNALLEAMSFAVVPLVSRVSGATDIVEDGCSGLLFDPGDLEAFVAKLEAALALPPGKRRAMGKVARETVRQKFGIDEVAERHVALYRALTEAARVQPCR